MRNFIRPMLVYIVLGTCLFSGVIFAQNDTCSKDRLSFLHNNPRSSTDYDNNYQKRFEDISKDLNTLFSSIIVSRLDNREGNEDITDYLGCITGGSSYVSLKTRGPYGNENDFTNAPLVIPSDIKNSSRAIVFTYPIIGHPSDKNWTIIPARPLIQCFSKSSTQWALVNEIGYEFTSKAVQIYPLNSPIHDQTWALVSSRMIGDTDGRLNISIISCSNNSFTTIWSRGDIIWGNVDSSLSTVRLSYLKRDDKGHIIRDNDLIHGPDPIRFYEILHVTEKGLE